MPLEAGYLLNKRYRIKRVLGQGGFGAVYLATDERLDLRCAVKESLSLSPTTERQFKREAKLLATLRHPNLPRVTHHFVVDDHQYLIMDYVEGEDLHARLAREGPLPEVDINRLAEKICEALVYLHNLDPPIYHRDIKPANIRITSSGDAILVDFGIAKKAVEGQKTTTSAMGVTPGFAPPEQYGLGYTDDLTDVYALGATLYNLASGHPPPESVERLFGGETLTPLVQSRPDLSAHTIAAISKALEIRREERFQNVSKFLAALKDTSFVHEPTLVEDKPITSMIDDVLAEREQPVRRVFRINRFVGIGVAVFLGALIFFMTSSGELMDLISNYFNPLSPTPALIMVKVSGTPIVVTQIVTPTTTFVSTPTPESPEYTLTPSPVPIQISTDNATAWRLYSQWEGEDMSIPISISRDGRSVAVLNNEQGVDVYDTLTGELIQDLTNIVVNRRILRTAFTGDSLLIQLDDEVIRFSLQTENVVERFSIPGRDMLLSPDGSRLAVREEFISIYDLQTRQRLNTLGGSYSQQKFAFSPDSRYFALTLRSDVQLFEIGPIWKERALLGHGEPAEGLIFTPDGSHLISAAGDVWNVATGDLIATFDSSTDLVAISNDGHLIAGADGSVWDLMTGETIGAIPVMNEQAWRLQFTADGKFLIRQPPSGPVEVWIVAPPGSLQDIVTTADNSSSPKREPITSLNISRLVRLEQVGEGQYSGITISPDGTMMAGWRNRMISILDLATGDEIAQFEVSIGISDASYVGEDFLIITNAFQGVERWEISTQRRKQEYDFSGQKIVASPDGKLFAVQDEYIQVVDVLLGESLYHLGSKDADQDFLFAPDSKSLVIAAGSGVGFWDVTAGLPVGQLGSHGADTGGLIFAQEGDRLISSSGDVWDVESGDLIASFETEAGLLTVSPDGQLIVGIDGSLWDGNNGQYLGDLETEAAHLAFTPDNQRLVWNAISGETFIYGIQPIAPQVISPPPASQAHDLIEVTAQQAPQLRLLGWWGNDNLMEARYLQDNLQPTASSFGERSYRDITLNPDGQTITALDDHGIVLINPLSGQEVKRYEIFLNPSTIHEVAYLGESLLVLKDRAGIERWDLESQTLQQRYNVTGRSLVPSQTGSLFALQEGGMVQVVDADSGEIRFQIRASEDAQGYQISPDGQTLAIVGNVVAELWNLTSGEREQNLWGHASDVYGLTFASDGSKLIAASGDAWDTTNGELSVQFDSAASIGAITPNGGVFIGEDGVVWDAVTGEQAGVLVDMRAPAADMFFTSDGKQLLWRTADGRIYIWGVRSSSPPSLPTPSIEIINAENVSGLAVDIHFGHGRLQNALWSLDDVFLAVNTSKNTVIYRADTLSRELAFLEATTLAFDDEGHVLIGSEEPLRLIDVASGELIQEFEQTSIDVASFSPDGKSLAIGGRVLTDGYRDGLALLNPSDGSTLILTEGFDRYDRVTSLAFNPDGDYLVASFPNQVTIWDLETAELVRNPISGNIKPAVISPDGEYIGYLTRYQIIVEKLDSDWEYFKINADGTPFFPSGVTHPRREPIDLTFEKNGRLLIFTRELDRTTFEATLALIEWDIDRGTAVIKEDNLINLTQLTSWYAEDYINEKPQNIPSLGLSPSEERFYSLTEDGKVRVWDTEGGDVLAQSATDYLDLMALSPDGKQIAVSNAIGEIELIDLASGEVVKTLKGEWYPDKLLYNSATILLALEIDGEISFIDTMDGSEMESYANDRFDNRDFICQSPEGRLIAAFQLTGGLQQLNIFSLSPDRPLFDMGLYPIPHSPAFSPDGGSLATIRRNMVELRDLQSGQIVLSLEGIGGPIGPLAFTPDGTNLIAASGEIWGIRDRRLTASFDNPNPTMSIRTNGEIIINQEGIIWDATTGELISMLAEISAPAINFEFTPGGELLIWQTEGGVIEVWSSIN